LQSLAKRTNSFGELWYCRVRPVFNKVFAVVVGLCCLILLISENQVFLTK
jgi:hypothetical protein